MMDLKQFMPKTDWVPQFDLVTGKEGAPAFRLETNNKDITGKIQSRLMSLTLTDNRGFEADQLDLELDDSDGKLDLPSRGDILTLELGWYGQALTPKGKFVVDEIEHSGAPDRLTVRARSADLRGELNAKHDKSYHKQTIESVVSTIAVKNKLKFLVGKELKDIIVHIDQTNESDLSFLTRLAQQEGAIASIKNGVLLFILQGQNKSSSGEELPVVEITRQAGDSHRFSLSDRDAYTGVVAKWWNIRTASEQTIEYQREESKSLKIDVSVSYSGGNGSSDEDSRKEDKKEDDNKKDKPKGRGKLDALKDAAKAGSTILNLPASMGLLNAKSGGGGLSFDGSLSYESEESSSLKSHQTTTTQQIAQKYMSGAKGNVLTLSRIYHNKEDATRAAEAVWLKMQRRSAKFAITLAKGRADLYPEMLAKIDGFKEKIDGMDWTIVKVTHNLNDSGFTTTLELEIKIDGVVAEKPKDPEIKT
ncbi:phage late control D family protein [Xenorhabdus sp. Reich]|uniref:Phage late control D family protein n=1 Tax=Xenorhabdus littoralis TaxID=2582835 RepID=A0ABU4SQC3_9GAMM|nr:phage late control D family protein [Xenorhabdus sp. Reich]MDX8000771.1 phage late control D family protein [Xenorhabdus sp. Reich]